jgi:hypothetical protein
MRTAVIIAGWLWCLAALPVLSDAGESLLFLALFLMGMLIGLIWTAYSIAVPAVFRNSRLRWLWLSVPAIGLLGVLLAATHRDLAIRVWLCESQLRDYAESFRRNPNAAQRFDHRWVGLFEVDGVSADGDQVMLYTARSGWLDSAGIVYRPDGAQPSFGRCEHLFGPWWWFWEDF